MSESGATQEFTVSFVLEAPGLDARSIRSDTPRIVVRARAGELLNQVAYRAGITIQQTCGGVPSCTDCKVVVKEGVDGGFEPALGPELRLMGNVYFITHERLSCQAIIAGDTCVFVPTPRRRSEKNAEHIALINRQRQEQRRDTGERDHGKKESKEKNGKKDD